MEKWVHSMKYIDMLPLTVPHAMAIYKIEVRFKKLSGKGLQAVDKEEV